MACPICNAKKGGGLLKDTKQNDHVINLNTNQPAATTDRPLDLCKGITQHLEKGSGNEIFVLRNSDYPGLLAIARYESGHMTVISGSTAKGSQGDNLGPSSKRLRNQLITNATLRTSKDGLLEFSEDTVFNSPSSAASVINAAERNGNVAWVLDGSNITLGEWVKGRKNT